MFDTTAQISSSSSKQFGSKKIPRICSQHRVEYISKISECLDQYWRRCSNRAEGGVCLECYVQYIITYVCQTLALQCRSEIPSYLSLSFPCLFLFSSFFLKKKLVLVFSHGERSSQIIPSLPLQYYWEASKGSAWGSTAEGGKRRQQNDVGGKLLWQSTPVIQLNPKDLFNRALKLVLIYSEESQLHWIKQKRRINDETTTTTWKT